MKKLITLLSAVFLAGALQAQTTITGAGTSGQVAYFNGTNSITGNNNLFTNGSSLGVGTNTLSFRLNVNTASLNDGLAITETGGSAAAIHMTSSSGGHHYGLFSTGGSFNSGQGGGGRFVIYDYTAAANRFIMDVNGYIGIGLTASTGFTLTPQTKLHIQDGSLKFTGTDPVHGAPNIFWGGTTASAADGEWALEYNSNLFGQAGLNFWRPNQSHFGNGTGTPQSTVNNVLFLSNYNRVGIRTNNPTADLTVNGTALIGDPAQVTSLPSGYNLYVQNGILTERLKVAVHSDPTNWSDYVFAPGYVPLTLDSVKSCIQANQHLPYVPSSSEVFNNGVDVAQMDAVLLRQIEELWLQTIHLQEELTATQAALAAQKQH